MPPSLRKACHACVSAKRKCNPQLPACERCATRQIQCVYDLEPISQSVPNPLPHNDLPASSASNEQHFRIVYDSVPNARDASASAMASGLDTDSSAAHPLLMADGETAVWLMKWFAGVGQDRVTSPFVHCRLPVVSGLSRVVCGMSNASSSGEDVLSVLAEIQDLITAALQRLLLDKPSVRRESETERIVQRVYSVAYALWSTADTLDLRHLPRCEAWRIAESIRRSMFAAIFVRGIWSVAGSGYCHYEPFLESLPFDPRAGLWEAETDEAWSAIVNQEYSGEHTLLKSWREFTEGSGGKQLSLCEDGQFQRMLYVSFHGSDGIRWLDELDKCKTRNSAVRA